MGKGKKIRTQILRIIVTVNSHHTGAYAAQCSSHKDGHGQNFRLIDCPVIVIF